MPRFPEYGHLHNDKLALCAPLCLNDNRRQHSLWACAGGDWPCGVLRGRGGWLDARPVLLCGRRAWLGRRGRVSP